jgi:hypothetical protein
MTRILAFALPVVIVIATLEGLVLALAMRRSYNWRAYFASLADALGRQYVVLTFFSLSLLHRPRRSRTGTICSRYKSIRPSAWLRS